MTALGFNESRALKTSALQNLSSLSVAKQRFLAKHIDSEKCLKKAVSMCRVNKQVLTSRIKSNRILKSKKRTDFVERILRDTESVLFAFINIFEWLCYIAKYP